MTEQIIGKIKVIKLLYVASTPMLIKFKLFFSRAYVCRLCPVR